MKTSLSLLNIFVAAIIAAFAPITLATPLITSVVETGGDNEATDTVPAKWTGVTYVGGIADEPVIGLPAGSSYTVGLFGNHAPTFVDRNHRYTNASATVLIPSYLLGGEYIMAGNDNRDNNPGYRLDVTVSSQVNVYMLIDNRLGGNAGDPPTFGAATMQWILDEGWTPVITGTNRFGTNVPDEVGIDESADGTINNWYSVYKKVFPPGTFQLKQPDNAGQNMYGVVVTLGVDPTNLPPVIANLSPANGAAFHSVTSGVSFNVRTLPPNTIPTQNIRLLLNGTDVSASLVVSGDATNRAVRYSGLASNTIYSGTIIASDGAGRGVTNNFAFDTFVRSGVLVIEAEDYNYGDGDCSTPSSPLDSFFGGLFIDNPAPGAYAMVPGGPAVGAAEADYHDNGTARGNTNSYRPCDYVGTIRSGDVLHPPFTNGGFPDFDLAQVQTNEWWNYTRTIPAGNYAVYLRVSSSAAQSLRFDKISGDITLPGQTITPVGTFLVPNTGTGYSYVRLTDALGSNAVVNFTGGAGTVRLTALGANNNLQPNFLMLVRVVAAVPPSVASVSPQPNASGVPLEAIITATLANGSTAVNPGTIVLRVNGTNVTASAAISNSAQGVTVTYDPPGLLVTNTAYTVSLQFSDNGAPTASFTNTWTFTTIAGTPFVTKVQQGTANHWGNPIWSNPPSTVAVSPIAGNSYVALAGGNPTRLRNPASGSGDAVIGVKTFPGDSLQLDAATEIRAKGPGNTLDFPGINGNAGLILNGGNMDNGDNGAVYPVTGVVLVQAPSGFTLGDSAADNSRGWIIGAQLRGSASLTVSKAFGDGPPAVEVTSSNNPFSGSWIVVGGLLKGTGSNSLGTGSFFVGPTTNAAPGLAKLEFMYDINTSGTLSLTNGGQLVLHQDCQFGGLIIDGVKLANGTYSSANLLAQYPNNFAPGGSGSVKVSGPVGLVLGNVNVSGTNFSFSFGTSNGVSYTVEYKNEIEQTNWVTLQTVAGTGGNVTVTNSIRSAAHRFIRVRTP